MTGAGTCSVGDVLFYVVCRGRELKKKGNDTIRYGDSREGGAWISLLPQTNVGSESLIWIIYMYLVIVKRTVFFYVMKMGKICMTERDKQTGRVIGHFHLPSYFTYLSTE